MTPFRHLGVALLLTTAVAWSGCRRQTPALLDEQERNDPAIQAAQALADAGDLAGAEARYDEILAQRPDFPRAHLDVAMLLMRTEQRPLKAMNHFMRYLELRPLTERRDLINLNIRAMVRMRLDELDRQVAALQAENEALRRAAGGTLPPAGTERRYTVKPGDTLIGIAEIHYGDGAQARKIFLANQAKMKNPNDLRAGIVLVIPP